MSDRTEIYDVAGVPSITIDCPAADIRFKEGTNGRIELQMGGSLEELDALEIDATSDAVTVRSKTKKRRWFGGSISILVLAPADSDLALHLGAGDVYCASPVGDLSVNLGSGDIRAESVGGTADLKLGSGDIRIGSIAGVGRVSSAAGDVRIDEATEITMSSAAGDVYFGHVRDIAGIKTATGDVRVRKFSGSDIEIKTMSGDIRVGLVSGMTVNAQIKTLSGDLRNRVKPSGGDKTGSMNLTITSFSGDVTLTSAK